MNRRSMMKLSAGAAILALGAGVAFAALPTLEKKDTYRVGFAQTESNNPWRIAQTKSMQDEAEKRGWQLVYTDAAGSAAKQVADVNSMIAQGVDAIFLAPREEKPLIPAVMNAKNNGIPVILLDRNVDASLAKPGEDYVTFIGSDFIEEGRRAAEWLTKEMGGNAKIIQLEGTTGSDPAAFVLESEGHLRSGEKRQFHSGTQLIQASNVAYTRAVRWVADYALLIVFKAPVEFRAVNYDHPSWTQKQLSLSLPHRPLYCDDYGSALRLKAAFDLLIEAAESQPGTPKHGPAGHALEASLRYVEEPD